MVVGGRARFSPSKEYRRQVPREWITSYLACDDCGREDCGCLEAALVDTVSAGRFKLPPVYTPPLTVPQLIPAVGFIAGYCAAGTARRSDQTSHRATD
jgi:hypothetical protein